MATPVVEAVRESMSRLPRRRDDRRVIAVREHRASAAWTRLTLADRGVEVLRCRDLKALHSLRECSLVVGLDDQVNVRALDTEMHDAEVLAPRGGQRGLADRLVDAA